MKVGWVGEFRLWDVVSLGNVLRMRKGAAVPAGLPPTKTLVCVPNFPKIPRITE